MTQQQNEGAAAPSTPTYSIGEAAKILRLPQHTARRWQARAALEGIDRRTAGDQRVYTLASIAEMAGAMHQEGVISEERHRLVAAVLAALLALYES